MIKLSPSQKKSLKWCLGNIELQPARAPCIPDAVLLDFCNALLQDQRWADIWTIDDVAEVLGEFVHHKSQLLAGSLGSLKAPGNVVLLDQLYDEAVWKFESYPRRYNLFIELPGLYWGAGAVADLPLSDAMTLLGTTAPSLEANQLIRPDRPLGDTSVASTMEEFLYAIAPVAAILLRRETVYLRIAEEGFLGISCLDEVPALLSSALVKLKILLVFGMEIGLLERKEVYRPPYPTDGDHSGPVHVACHEVDGSGKACLDVPTDMANFLRGIVFVNSDQIIISGIKDLLAPILGFIEKLGSDEHAVGIGAGIEWLLDSLISSNQTISLLQCCIGIESILGEKSSGMQELGTTARLAERYSYLMGHSLPDRLQLREDFRRIFQKRGELIHARKTRLSLRDHWVVPKAQEMLQQLIRKELSLYLDIDLACLSRMQLDYLRENYSFSRFH